MLYWNKYDLEVYWQSRAGAGRIIRKDNKDEMVWMRTDYLGDYCGDIYPDTSD
jgi:hypothetical protein